MRLKCIKDFPVTVGAQPLIKKGKIYEADIKNVYGIDIYYFLDGKVKFSSLTIGSYFEPVSNVIVSVRTTEEQDSFKAWRDKYKIIIDQMLKELYMIQPAGSLLMDFDFGNVIFYPKKKEGL